MILGPTVLAAAVAGLVATGVAVGASSERENGAAKPAPARPVAPVGRLPGYNVDRNAYFGDLHVHTYLSNDAYISNARRTPDDAYRFARGEAI